MSKCSRFTKSRSALIHESSWIRTENVCFSAEKSLISGICMTRISFPWKSSICKKNKGKHVRLQSDSNGLYGLWLEGMFLFWYEIVSLVTLLYSGAPPRRNALDLAFLVNIRLFSVLRILKRILLQWTWPADTLFANQCMTCSCFDFFWMSKVKSWIDFQHNKLCYDFCQIWHIVKNLIFIFKILSSQFSGILQRNICVRIRFGKTTRKVTKIV